MFALSFPFFHVIIFGISGDYQREATRVERGYDPVPWSFMFPKTPPLSAFEANSGKQVFEWKALPLGASSCLALSTRICAHAASRAPDAHRAHGSANANTA